MNFDFFWNFKDLGAILYDRPLGLYIDEYSMLKEFV
jgi:hypothetical protein